MEYRKFGTAQKRETLLGNLTQIEQQHYARSLDAEHWRRVMDSSLEAAVAVDDRIVNNRNEQAKAELAGALFDIEKLELKHRVLTEELEKLENDPKVDAAKSGNA